MSGKYCFTLKISNREKIESDFGLDSFSNLSRNQKKTLNNVTKIGDLESFNQPEIISFLDEAKRNKKCIITMHSRFPEGFLPDRTDIFCWWCRHDFNTSPIGCPLRYVSNHLVKNYTSEITKDNYVIKENVSSMVSLEKVSENERITYKKVENDFYETEGVFCSFNCCLAYIEDNKNRPDYRNSIVLLNKIYKQLTGNTIDKIFPSPNWKLLGKYGGHLNIEEFRNKFNKVQYIDQGKIMSKRMFKTFGRMFEEKDKF